jgi:hypothetical protein
MEFVFSSDAGAQLRGSYSSYLKTNDEQLTEFAIRIGFKRGEPKYYLIKDGEFRHAGFARDDDTRVKLLTYMNGVFFKYLGMKDSPKK